MAPPSQRYRQVGFYLEGEGSPVKLDLTIRPEDLRVNDASRVVVQQTMGGAWADVWGRGLTQVHLSGTTGWRGGALVSGEDAFLALRSTVFTAWHQRREDAVSTGNDPDSVTLTFVDTLDDLTLAVIPESFALSRSKSSPLLIRYNIRLIALGDAASPLGILDQITKALSNPLRWLAGVTGVGNLLGTLQGYINTGLNLWGAASSVVGNLMGTVSGLMSSVMEVAGAAKGVFGGRDAELLSAARLVCQAGANALVALDTDPTLPEYELIPAARLPALLVEADCTMANSFTTGRTFPSYDDLFGASNCSSTGGGDPASPSTVQGLNPLDLYFPVEQPTVVISPLAMEAINALRRDPLLYRGRNELIASQLATISAGVRLP